MSIIIPIRNSPIYVKRVLNSVESLSYSREKHEVIIVDNSSTEDTTSTVLPFKRIFKPFTYSFEKKPGLPNARHKGLFLAKVDILVYIDDVKPFSQLINSIAIHKELG